MSWSAADRRLATLAALLLAYACSDAGGGAAASGEPTPSPPTPRSAPGRAVALRPPPALDPALVGRGRAIFHGEGACRVCHGEDGRGARGVGADLTDATWWHGDGSWAAIAHTVASGVAASAARNAWGASMPVRGGLDLSDEEVWAVAAYVRSLVADSSGPS